MTSSSCGVAHLSLRGFSGFEVLEDFSNMLGHERRYTPPAGRGALQASSIVLETDSLPSDSAPRQCCCYSRFRYFSLRTHTRYSDNLMCLGGDLLLSTRKLLPWSLYATLFCIYTNQTMPLCWKEVTRLLLRRAGCTGAALRIRGKMWYTLLCSLLLSRKNLIVIDLKCRRRSRPNGGD